MPQIAGQVKANLHQRGVLLPPGWRAQVRGVRYNGRMSTEADPYEVLGVSREADLDEVKAAFRRAALECHPDRYVDDHVEFERAARRLRQVIEAYRAIVRSFVPGAWAPWDDARTYTPQDFAREGLGGLYAAILLDGEPIGEFAWPGIAYRRRQTYATRNETAVFIALWALAVMLGIVVGLCAVGGGAVYRGPDPPADLAGLLTSVALAEGAYLAVAAVAVLLILLTRKMVRFTIQFAAQRWRFLPAPRPDHQLPDPAPGGKLPRERDRRRA